MRTLAILLIFLLGAGQLPAQVVDFPFPRNLPPFKGKSGRYSGIITVVERIPRPPASALLPDPPAGSFLQAKASGRVTAVLFGGRMRILGQPRSTLLSYLDEPSYASIVIDSIVTFPGPGFLGYIAKARNGIGDVAVHGNRVRMRFKLSKDRADFASNEQTVTSTVLVDVTLTRAGD